MRFGFGLYMFEEGLSFRVVNTYFKLPIKPWRNIRDVCESWGVCYAESTLMLYWGTIPGREPYPDQGSSRVKFIYMPWDWGSNVRHEVQLADGSLVKMPGWTREHRPIPNPAKFYVEPYRYTLNNGTLQSVMAKFYVEEREWRWRIFHKLPFRFGPKILNRSISIEFSSEIGERTGSWKGGCTGCSYKMLSNETPVACLRRMELERSF